MSSQKFIARNRAPRVQIEYDVELYGAEKKVQLPFVMGVMANLSGNPAEALPPVPERNFLEVSGDIVERVDPVFYSDPMTAAMKALGMT